MLPPSYLLGYQEPSSVGFVAGRAKAVVARRARYGSTWCMMCAFWGAEVWWPGCVLTDILERDAGVVMLCE